MSGCVLASQLCFAPYRHPVLDLSAFYISDINIFLPAYHRHYSCFINIFIRIVIKVFYRWVFMAWVFCRWFYSWADWCLRIILELDIFDVLGHSGWFLIGYMLLIVYLAHCLPDLLFSVGFFWLPVFSVLFFTWFIFIPIRCIVCMACLFAGIIGCMDHLAHCLLCSLFTVLTVYLPSFFTMLIAYLVLCLPESLLA